MKISIFTIIFFVTNLVSFAQAPDYYDNVNLNLSGQDLLNELASKITDTQTTFLSYTPGVWEALQSSDLNPNNNSDVLLIYGFNDNDSDITNDRSRGVNENGGNSNNWNREHVFPRSLANPNLGTTGAGADAHNLRPADITRNSSRANRKFADGSGNSGITTSGYWYPGDEWKGDVARMVMFMYLRYGDRCMPSAVGIGNALSSDSSMIDLFLEWNIEDPVSSFEQQRNEIITNIQGNRNPFIDNPAFATSIWGGEQAEDLFGNGNSGGGATNNNNLIISEYVEGSSFNKAIEVANISSSSINLSDYSLKRDTNGSGAWSSPLNLSGSLASGNVFVITSSQASSSLTALADQTSTSSVLTFNGNDPIGLFYNDTLIDIVGTFGGGSSNNFGANKTLVRNNNANPTTTYISSQWTSFNSDTYSNLGFHGESTTISATLTIIFDNYSSETSWEILDNNNTTISFGNNYNFSNGSSTSINMTLDVGNCYTLNFFDSYGDGICCTYGNGSYTLTNDATGTVLASGGSFGFSESSNFCTFSSSSAKSLLSNVEQIPQTINNFELTVYPNPSSEFIKFSTDYKIENANYIIYNQAGTEIRSGVSINNSISITDLAVGIYFIKINNLPSIQFIKN